MANYCPYCRSSYFLVRDEEEFKTWCNKLGLTPIFNVSPITKERLCGFIAPEGIPFSYLNDDDSEIEIDFEDEIAQHLATGWVAIIQEVGHEAMRYLTGVAIAVNWKGKTHHISLDDVYLGARLLGQFTQVAY